MVKTKTGVDGFTSIALEFEKMDAVAYLSTSLTVSTSSTGGIIIQGDLVSSQHLIFLSNANRPHYRGRLLYLTIQPGLVHMKFAFQENP